MHQKELSAPERIAVAVRLLASVCVLVSLLAETALGQENHSDPHRFWKWPAKDATALVNKAFVEETIFVLGTGGLILLTTRHDADITRELAEATRHPDLLVRVVEEVGNVRAVRPLAGVLFFGSLLTDNARFQDAAFTSLEAVVLANLFTSGLKSAFGRARPFQDQGPLEFKPFSGNTSFPSGHATTAFAFVTPWLMYYPNVVTPGLLILGAGTAFTRMLTDNHWFTDVVAGSAIGFSTAYVLARRHQQSVRRVRIAPSVGLEQYGLTVSVQMP